MNKELLRNNYLIVKNFISKENALQWGLDFVEFSKTRLHEGDTQVPKAFSVHCPKNGQDILYKKCDEVSNIVGCKLLPTYS